MLKKRHVEADIAFVAIDERNMTAAVDGDADKSEGSLDDLRLRLDSPLFARESGLAAAAPVPRLRELTWQHVINPTSTHPAVRDERSTDVPVDADGVPRPTPIRIEDLLARPQPALAPLPARPDSPPTSNPLPSFAAMVSTEVDATSDSLSWETDRLSDEVLVKPIEEPPPVARDTDPAVAGLAELIMRSTPGTGMPRVEDVHESLRMPTGSVQVIDDQFGPPVLDAAIEFATAQSASPVAPTPSMTPPSARHTGVTPMVRNTGFTPVVRGSVEAELNRLAYVPDQQDDVPGPVAVPEIAYSDVRSADPVLGVQMTGPTLSQHEMFQPRQSTQTQRHTFTDLVSQAAPVVRHRKRHVLRNIVTTFVLLGMVAGGLYAVKYFVLDRVKWPSEIQALATAVETTRGLHFQHDVPVVTLSPDEYSLKIAASLGGVTADNVANIESEWRAVGVLTGALDRRSLGLSAMADSPAFYDSTSQSIFVVDELKPELKTFALHRALTMALLDQQYKWSKQLVGSAPTVVIGTRALYDGDALSVAQTLLSPADRAEIPKQLFEMYTTYQITASPAPFASAMMGRLGVGLYPYLDTLSKEDRDALETAGALTDNHAFDLRRLTTGGTDLVGSTTQGMLFWYHALAARLDDDVAWNAALAWRNDEMAIDTTGAQACVTATITAGAAGAPAAAFAFAAWAAAAPSASATTVTATAAADGGSQIVVHACDPGAAVPTNDGAPRLLLGGAPLRAAQYARLLAAQPRLTPTQVACSIYGADPLTATDERSLVDGADGWAALAAHPLPDPVAMKCSPPVTTP